MQRINSLFLFFILFGLLPTTSGVSRGATRLTPTSPEVKASVAKAVEYLEKNGDKEKRTGGKALIGLALLKAGADPNHPLIVDAVRDVQRCVPGIIRFSYPIYALGISAMFLSELDPELYHEELTTIGEYLRITQQREGGWGYLAGEKPSSINGGDMSMTQYAVMGSWMIHKNGGTASTPMMLAVGKWLLAVQTEEGAYAYTTRNTTTGWSHVEVRPSTTAAGMASVYVVCEFFGLADTSKPLMDFGESELPSAFRKRQKIFVETTNAEQSSLTAKDFVQVQERGSKYLQQCLQLDPKKVRYLNYYFYALERYFAFREIVERKRYESPEWYNKLANILFQTQKSDGSWPLGGLETEVDTAYGILVLLRSTQRTLGKGLDSGALRGGRGLPSSTEQTIVRDGQVISLSEVANVEELLDRLEQMNELDEQTVAQLSKIPGREREKLFSQKKDRLRNMTEAASPEARLAAVGILEKSGDIRNAPLLIDALDDPDPIVADAAQQALLTISRNPKGKRLPAPTDPSYETVRKEQIEYWKNWYKGIVPDEF